MYCPNCGKQNPDEARFCFACGTPLNIEQSAHHDQPAATPVETPVNETYESPPLPDEPTQFSQLWKTVKTYLPYVIIIGFIYTFFSLLNVKGSSREDDELESGRLKFNGITMLTGRLPEIYDDQEHRSMNSEITSEMRGPEQLLLRTPLMFRIGYIILTLGTIFYLFTVFVFNEPRQRYLNSIARGVCFFSAFSIYWVYNDFEKWPERIMGGMRGFLSIRVETNFSIGFWLLFLSFVLLTADYVVSTIKAAKGQNGNFGIKKIQTT